MANIHDIHTRVELVLFIKDYWAEHVVGRRNADDRFVRMFKPALPNIQPSYPLMHLVGLSAVSIDTFTKQHASVVTGEYCQLTQSDVIRMMGELDRGDHGNSAGDDLYLRMYHSHLSYIINTMITDDYVVAYRCYKEDL